MRRLAVALCCAVVTVLPSTVLAQQKVNVEGYAEWQSSEVVIVDGQRVRRDDRTRFTDKRWAEVELGDEMKVEGTRQPDGTILASVVTAKKNGTSMFEADALEQADEAEDQWLEVGEIEDDEDEDAPAMEIFDSGRSVDRVRVIVDRLMPPYLDPEDFRVYVVADEEWNAFAMANGSVWVHTGLLADMNDAELAIVLGHEIAHVTHEHIRRSMKKDMWYGVLQGGVELVTDSGTAQVIAGGVSLVRQNKYSRDLEDQADRVGLRYAYEAGFDTSVATALWRRFDEKYGSEDKVTNFLFGGHSRSVDRVRKLDTQIALNYRDGAGGRSRRDSAAPANAPLGDDATRSDRGTRPAPPAEPASAGGVLTVEGTLVKKQRQSGAKPRTHGETRTMVDALASLRKGMTPDEVASVLGRPVSTERDGDSLIWHYEDEFDVEFAGGRLRKVRPR